MNVRDRIETLKDEVARLGKIIEEDGYMIPGSRGEMRVHPAIRERHAAIALIARLERSLPADDDEDLDLD